MESIETDKSLRSEARIALVREKVALSKLEHLKFRYDAIYNELAATKKELLQREEALRASQEREADSSRLALHWRTEFYRQMDALDGTKQHLVLAKHELELSSEQAGFREA